MQAYLIEDVRALSDLFKVGAGPKNHKDNQFVVYRVRHPEFQARRALVITGIHKSQLAQPIPATVGKSIDVESKDGELFLLEGKKQHPFEVFTVASSNTLGELIEPVAWRSEAEHDLPIVFWLHDPALMPDLVRRSLYLNNDRVQLATVDDAAGEQSMLIRIEAPSYYLIAWSQEQGASKIELFYPMAESPGLFVQWGCEHPLADVWKRSWDERKDGWIFFPATAARRAVPRPEWQSLYEVVDFALDVHDADAWKAGAAQAARFQVPLLLTPRHEPAPIELVLLHADERPAIERYLALANDEDLDRLEISAQRDAEDHIWFFIREKHRGDGALLLEFGGRGFARYKGFDNLYLPVELVLEPQVRRDQYRVLFGLDGGSLTFVVPGRTAAEPTRRVRVPRSSFEPLAHFVDHIVHFDRAAMEAILADSVFDLGPYLRAPSMPGVRQKEREERDPKRTNDATEQDRQDAKLAASRQRRARVVSDTAPRGQEMAAVISATREETPGELELLETQIEREIIRHRGRAELWGDLLTIKERREKWLEATMCAVEGMWQAAFPDEEPDAQAEQDALEIQVELRDGLIQAVQRGGGQPADLAIVSQLFGQLQGPSTPQQLAHLMQSAGQLRGVEATLSKKIRWLAWREILRRTGDVRTQEEVREAILTALHTQGLTQQDMPVFLRERILKDPELELDEDVEAGGADTSYLVQNVEVIEQTLSNLRTVKIREASFASLSRIYAQMGLHARSRDMIERALSAMNTSLGTLMGDSTANKPWHTRIVDFFLARPQGAQDAKSRPERWHVWVALNAWLVFQRVEPARAEQAKQVYEVMFQRLAGYEQEEIKRARESLEKRIGQSNVAEFLAADSRSFFSSRELPDEMSRVVRELGKAQPKREAQVNDLVLRGIELAKRELNAASSPSLETVSRLILEMVEVLRKLKWERENRPVEQFEEFVRALPAEPATKEASRLYFAVLHCAAARAMMDLGREKDAMVMLTRTLRWVAKDYMQVLDFVDLVKKEVLLAVELSPRNQRTDALRTLMQALVEQERLEIGEDKDRPGQGFELPFQAYEIIQMIDHTLEAAISNEKLVLRRLRDFEEREEARIRYWVQRDQPATLGT
jgi:hypothetical protein